MEQSCPHNTLVAVEGLYGFYHCRACGDFFNLALINLTSHTAADMAAMAHWLFRAAAHYRNERTGTESETDGLSDPTNDTATSAAQPTAERTAA